MEKNALTLRSPFSLFMNFGITSLLLMLSFVNLAGQDIQSSKSNFLRNEADYRQFLAQHDLV